MIIRLFKFLIILLLCFSFTVYVVCFAQQASVMEPVKSEPGLKFKINTREGIYRNRSPIVVDLLFINDSSAPQKICTYNFYDALLKLDVFDSKGKRVDFNPKLLQILEKISDKDWVLILPGRTYKRSFSLTRKMIDLTGYKLKPGNYKIKATYEGCSKFDANIPPVLLKSNLLHILVTE